MRNDRVQEAGGGLITLIRDNMTFTTTDIPSTFNTYIIAPIAQLVSALDLVTLSVQVEGLILTAGKRLSLKNLNVIIRAIN